MLFGDLKNGGKVTIDVNDGEITLKIESVEEEKVEIL